MQLQDLPTIHEIEWALQRSTPGKAPGNDHLPPALLRWGCPAISKHVHQLMCKVFWQQSEPILWKGGTLAPIHKRGSVMEVSNYRGVMLLPTLSKTIHAVLRSRIVTQLLPQKPAWLLGGFPHQRVTFASHRIRTSTRLAQHLTISSCILFLDLASAYHLLVRALSLGLGEGQLRDLDATLEALPNAVAKKRCAMHALQPGVLEHSGLSPALCALLQELHCDTFFTMRQNPAWIRTARGSRPGSPLADIVFGCLMLKLHALCEDVLQSTPEVAEASRSMGFPPIVATWADDVALELFGKSPSVLLDAVKSIMSRVHLLFTEHGMTLNMKVGKTSAVVALRGPGAPELRLRRVIQNQGCSFESCIGPQWLPFVCQYTHLGTQYVGTGDLQAEFRIRIGQAASAFATLRKPIFANRGLSIPTRCRLLECLVLSKLFFGAGAWQALKPRSLRSLQAVTSSFYRTIFDQHFWNEHRITDDACLLPLESLHPAFVLPVKG